MNEEKTGLERQIAELGTLEPLAVTFKGKVRMVHFFHEGTAESFNSMLASASEYDTMKDRHRREVRLLAIVLADLHGMRVFRKVRRWLWEKRLSFGKYDEVEALQLLDAAVTRIQQGKYFELYASLIVAQIQAMIEAMSRQQDEANQCYNEKLNYWKGETA